MERHRVVRNETEVVVRDAERSDIPELIRVTRETFAMACPPSTAPDAIEEYLREHATEPSFEQFIANPQTDVLVACFESSVAGYAILAQNAPPSIQSAGPWTELSKCYVRSAYHGRGIAGALMDEATRRAGRQRATGMWLSVSEENGRAIAFYRKHGFEEFGRTEFAVASEIHRDLIMVRSLGSL